MNYLHRRTNHAEEHAPCITDISTTPNTTGAGRITAAPRRRRTASGQARRRRGVDPDPAVRASDERLRADHRTRDPQRRPLASESGRHLSGAAQARRSRVDHLHRGGRQAPVRADRPRSHDARLLRGGTGRRRRSAVERGRRRPIARATCAPWCSRWWGRPGESVVSAPPSRSNRPGRSSPRRPPSSTALTARRRSVAGI